MPIKFDEVVEFDEEKYKDNISRHTFADEDGRWGDVKDE